MNRIYIKPYRIIYKSLNDSILCCLCFFILMMLCGIGSVSARECNSLPPLDEAAIKHSPGNLISDTLKKNKQFLFLNELLLVDELILKQARLKGAVKDKPNNECGDMPRELYCQQIEVILHQKQKTLKKLEEVLIKPDFSGFSDLDMLIELEFVDDLIIVQPLVRKVLYDIIMQCQNVRIKASELLMNKQIELLLIKKQAIIDHTTNK